MRVIILAAGKGTRLLPLTKDTPKPLIRLQEDLTILDTQLKTFSDCGIKDFIIITGYLSRKVEEHLKEHLDEYSELNIKIVFNPFYEVANNLASLWMARREMEEDDFIVVNGDNVIHKSAVEKLLRDSGDDGLFMVISRKDKYDDDDMKVITAKNNVLKVSKQIPKDMANGESVGFIKFCGEEKYKFLKIMDELMYYQETLGKFWLTAVQEYIDQTKKLNFIEIPRTSWYEIDFHPDLSTVQNKVKEAIRTLSFNSIFNEVFKDQKE